MDERDYQEFAAVLNRCDKEINELYHNYALRHQISDAALWIVYAVHEGDEGLTQADLCDAWYFSRQTINSALKKLEGAGKLCLVPAGHRRKRICFTPEGRAWAEALLWELLQAEKQAASALTREELRQFLDLSQKWCALLRGKMEPQNTAERIV